MRARKPAPGLSLRATGLVWNVLNINKVSFSKTKDIFFLVEVWNWRTPGELQDTRVVNCRTPLEGIYSSPIIYNNIDTIDNII